MTRNEKLSIIPISFKEKLLGFICADQYLTPALHLLYHLNIVQNYSACSHIWMLQIKTMFQNLLCLSCSLIREKTDILVRRDLGFECFRYVFPHFIVLFDRLIAFLFATCTLCCISTGSAAPKPCISKRHLLKGLMNYSFPNNPALTPCKIPKGRSVIFVLQRLFSSFSVGCQFSFLIFPQLS